MFLLKFQTAENVPPPFAFAIEVSGKIVENQEIEIDFEINYLGREELSVEEIEEEGFTENDDFSWKGSLPKVWKDILFGTLKVSNPLKIKELRAHEDYYEINFEQKTFYPKNTDEWKYLIEELKQAVFEKAEIESPLNLHFIKIRDAKTEYKLHASFSERNIFVEIEDSNGKYEKEIEWNELNFILKNAFSGEFLSDSASNQKPNRSGIFINIGDEFWYEVGKTWQIQPSKINQVFRLFDN